MYNSRMNYLNRLTVFFVLLYSFGQDSFALSLEDYQGTYRCLGSSISVPKVDEVGTFHKEIKIKMSVLSETAASFEWQAGAKSYKQEIQNFRIDDPNFRFNGKSQFIRFEKPGDVPGLAEAVEFSVKRKKKRLMLILNIKEERVAATECEFVTGGGK